MDTLWQDLRHGARMLAKNPGFTFVAVLSIALGIGANAAMFSLADAMVLRPLQVPHADDLIAVTGSPSDQSAGLLRNRAVSYGDYVDLRDRATVFAGLIAYRVAITSFTDRSDQPAQSRLGLAVSGNFFDVLELRPALGRTFRPRDDQVPAGEPVLVLAHDIWREQFASDPAVVGRRLRVGGVDFTVIGVAPAQFPGMDLVLHPAFYLPLGTVPLLAGSTPDALERRDVRTLALRGRLKPGVSMQQAQQEVDNIARGLQQAYPDTNRRIGFLVTTAFAEQVEGRGPSGPAAFIAMALALMVLLVACANVAGLLMSRAPVRQREIALRLAIGGSRFRVTRQLLTESSLLAIGGALSGLAIGYASIRFFGALQVVSDIGVKPVFRFDSRVLGVALVLTAASVFLSSLVPAWRAAQSSDIAGALKPGIPDALRSRLWGRNVLVVGQVALSLAILTVSVFLYRAFEAEFGRPGFRTGRMLLVNFDPALAGYDGDRSAGFYRLLAERARAIPTVTSVGLTSVMPLNQDYRERSNVIPEGFQFPVGTDSVSVFSARVDEGYLRTMGIRLLAGREFSTADTADAPRVAIVNESMASRYWPGRNPIGKRVRVRAGDDTEFLVVGVAADSKYNWIGEAPTPFLYLPHRQVVQGSGSRRTFLLASDGEAAALASSVRQIVRDIDPTMPMSALRTMEDYYYGSAVSAISGFIRVVGAIGLVGLLLAMVGLYGLVSYAVARRTHEFGIRAAIGARPGVVLRMVLRQGLLLALAGVVIGVVASAVAGGFLSVVVPTSHRGIDMVTYLLVVPALLATTLVAAYIPAWRAARIDPLRALRSE